MLKFLIFLPLTATTSPTIRALLVFTWAMNITKTEIFWVTCYNLTIWIVSYHYLLKCPHMVSLAFKLGENWAAVEESLIRQRSRDHSHIAL